MANIFEQKSRNVLPNFRSFKDTAELGELGAFAAVTTAPRFDMQEVLADWEAVPSIGTAGDLLSSAVVSGASDVPAVRRAAEFVRDRTSSASQAQMQMAASILGHGEPEHDAWSVPSIQRFLDETGTDCRQRIHRLRGTAARFVWNPILYVELARLYSIIGNAKRAQRNMSIALGLAPSSRFVLRSAARMYAHLGAADIGYQLLLRNPSTVKDPWLLSAELALATILQRHAKPVKQARALLASRDYSPFSLGELNSGLATLELLEGSRRKSKELLRASLRQPNDNVLAQVVWIMSQDRLFDFDIGTSGVKKGYEARALGAFSSENWTRVVDCAESWFIDMPFAKRPVMLGSHVASIALEDYPKAQLFCRAGLVAHPHDAQLLNNYAYALALDGQTVSASAILDDLDPDSLEREGTRACVIATKGLVHFRRGDIQAGRAHYQRALAIAATIPERSYRQLALLNLAREEIRAGTPESRRIIEEVGQLEVNPKAATIAVFRDKVLSLYSSTP